MDLRPRLQALHIPIAQLMRDLGYRSYPSFYERISGKHPITSLAFAKKVEAATNGEIKAVWILGLEQPPTHSFTSLPTAG